MSWRSALEEANRIRLHRAAVKRRIAKGELTVAEAMEDPIVCSTSHGRRGMKLGQLLEAQRYWGPDKSARFLRRLGFDRRTLATPVGDLTDWQRRRIADRLD